MHGFKGREDRPHMILQEVLPRLLAMSDQLNEAIDQLVHQINQHARGLLPLEI